MSSITMTHCLLTTVIKTAKKINDIYTHKATSCHSGLTFSSLKILLNFVKNY